MKEGKNIVRKIVFGFRVLLESVLLWSGGFVLLLVLAGIADSSELLEPLVSGNEIPVNIGIGAALLAGIIWILAARKKEMSDRMHGGVYIALNLLALVPVCVFAWAYLHSFD